MVPLPGNLLTKMSIDADMVRRMHEDNPFFRARADRYAQLDAAIRELEAHPDAATTARKYLTMLKKRQEGILLELVDLIVAVTPSTQEPLWKIPPVPRQANMAKLSPNRSWQWP